MVAPYNWRAGQRVKMLVNAVWRMGIVSWYDNEERIVYIDWDNRLTSAYFPRDWKYIKRYDKKEPKQNKYEKK